MSDVDCLRCDRPVHDNAYICGVCGTTLIRRLEELAAIAGEAMTTIARQARLGTGGGRAAETPLPFSWDAAADQWAVANTLTTWARHISEQRGLPIPAPPGPTLGPPCRAWVACKHPSCAAITGHVGVHPLVHVSAWLIGQVAWLRHRPEADQAFDELHNAVRLAIRTVDLPPVRWFAGPCDGCTLDLYAMPGAAVVRCPECQTEHDADARRDWLLEQAMDLLAHAALAAQALTALGHTVAENTVRQWASRGRIVAHGVDTRGRPQYRVGEVLELARANERRRAERVG